MVAALDYSNVCLILMNKYAAQNYCSVHIVYNLIDIRNPQVRLTIKLLHTFVQWVNDSKP